MKFKRRQVRAEQVRLEEEKEKKMSGNEQVRREIQCFLRALHSYPERFSKEPDVTFEEHRSSLQTSIQSDQRRRA